jgi:hypothetical protein
MDFITGKHISRRKVLRGLSATLALPLLDAMLPARKLLASTAAGRSLEATRLICIEMVHGAAGSNELGAENFLWAPEAVGHDFDLSPSSLSPLEPYRDYLTIVSNTDVEMAEAFSSREIGGDHFRSSATFLTQAHAKQTEGSDVHVGPSMDQLYAQRFGQETPIPSMQLCIENVDQAGGCAYGYACVYTDTISWASASQPLPMIRDPRVAFDQLFGSGGTPEQRALRRQTDRSILDWIMGEVDSLKRELGPSDRHRLNEYLQNIREIERRIQKVEEHSRSGEQREMPEAPAGVPDSFREHMETMFDLQWLAFSSDLTRVFSFKMGRDGSGRVYPESGIDRAFHPASHHGGREESVKEFAEINRFHVGMIPYLLDRLQNTQDGDATLLDKTLILYGSPMGDSNLHNHKRCPLFLIGGANGHLKGNVHVKAPDGTPMANVMLSLLHGLGMTDMKQFGNSSGEYTL